MTADSQWAVQAAVYSTLTGDSTLQAIIGNPARVFDTMPQDTDFPYVVIGENEAAAFDTKTEDGMEQTFTLHSWSRYDGLKEVKDIMAAITGALDNVALSVTGHDLVYLRFTFAATFLDPDGRTRHGVQRFRCLTQAS